MRRLSQKTSTLEGQHNVALVKHFLQIVAVFWLQVSLCIRLNLVEVKTRTVFDDRSILRPLGGLECEDKSRLEVEG